MKGIIEKFRKSVVGVNLEVPLLSGELVPAINLDNAATTPPFYSVMREIADFMPWYSSVHRGAGYKSLLSSEIYENGRKIIKNFVKADPAQDDVIYTKNTTEAINLLASLLAQDNEGEAVVLSTGMEHLANDLPWRGRFKLDYVAIDATGRLAMEDLEQKLRKYEGRVMLVTVTGASNVTGFKNPIGRIAAAAHKYGAHILVDGAQWVPHCPVDMKPFGDPEHIDYLVFSAHKMYAPFGIGVLIGPKAVFNSAIPFIQGGGAVKLVSTEFVEWEDSPYNHEAGTPNVVGIVALLAAIKTLERLNMGIVETYETELLQYAEKALQKIPGLRLYGSAGKLADKVSILSFDLKGLHHGLLAKILSCEAGVAVRSGLFCAHPYVEKMLGLTEEEICYYRKSPEVPLPGLVRISLGLYNTYHELDVFLDCLKWIAENTKQCKEKYEEILKREPAQNSYLLSPPWKKMP